MTEYITNFLSSNQFASGGLLLMLLGSLGYYLRVIPLLIYYQIRKSLITTVEVSTFDDCFYWLAFWLSEHDYARKNRAMKASSRYPDDSNRPILYLSVAQGTHYMLYKGVLMLVSREASNQGAKQGEKEDEKFRVTFFTRRKEIVKELFEEALHLYLPPEEKRITIMRAQGSNWRNLGTKLPRNLDTIVLKANQKDLLISDIEKFKNSEAWYTNNGIPYRRGYLLYGPPGTGKTSLVYGLASHFQMNIATLSLSSGTVSDSELVSLIAYIPRHTVLLIEDIDCVFAKRESKSLGLTFSGLLNALDGVATAEGHILFMTTNYPEKIDNALKRPGRADFHMEIGLPDEEQIENLYRRHFPQGNFSEFRSMLQAAPSMADVQGKLLELHQ